MRVTVFFSALQHSATQCSAVHRSPVQLSAVKSSAVQCKSDSFRLPIQFHTVKTVEYYQDSGILSRRLQPVSQSVRL